jgi:RNA polymerase sigma factor (sigma-70 family)
VEPEHALLRGIERGDPAALETLARQYAPPVYRYLTRLSGDATLAEDLAQEVAIQLWRALPGRRFPNGRALNSWVYTVATNAFRMHVRRRRAGEVPLEPELDLAAGPEADPALAAERGDLAARIRSAVEALPEAERRAVLLKTYGDLRYREIAEATGEPVGTVKWRVAQAYARLRRVLLPVAAGLDREGEEREDAGDAMRGTAAVSGRRDGCARAVARGAAPAGLP